MNVLPPQKGGGVRAEENGVPAAHVAFQMGATLSQDGEIGFSPSLTGAGVLPSHPRGAFSVLEATTEQSRCKVNVLHVASEGLRLH